MSAGIVTNDYYKNPYPLAGDSDKANVDIDSLLKRLNNTASMRNIRVREFFHDYDKLRKKLILWGVTEDKLAILGLSSIEENASNVRKFVEIHEFRY
jgi:hypothetical protein